ncbi:uncharacterized protein LOC106173490 [Lingula anatina]|uniref:Uncharacterized protein LOC106173490 n=1 Tax=Lingula anatina TaxID=7574 RepID=A0A2R2MRM7_LINAN|nr:uncharacterized protein LOC106173490 [Lingula anatina]|eukprot:XP_023932793.1 uncharacterized protein LOC106173490 [Lingula anatina]
MADREFKTQLGTRTNTSGGLAVIHELFNENQRNVTDAKMVIVITDGKPNSDKEATIPNADALKADGVKIMAIGVGDDIRRDNLEDIASEPYERYVFTTEDFEDLIARTEDMVQTACRNVEYLSCPEQESNDRIVDAQHAAIEKAIASLLETNEVLTELDERCNVDPCPSCFTRNDEFRSCYKAVPAAVDWPEADRLCAVLYGARLASVNTAEEHHYIKNQTFSSEDATSAGITKWWVSGNDLANHGTLMWAGDGHSVNLTVTGDHAHHCVLMDGTNHLNLVRVACGASHGFVCEKNY